MREIALPPPPLPPRTGTRLTPTSPPLLLPPSTATPWIGKFRFGLDVDEDPPFVMTAVFKEEMEVVEGMDVSCSCVGDPRVLGTRESRGMRLPAVGVTEVMGVETASVLVVVEVVVKEVERGREDEEMEGKE